MLTSIVSIERSEGKTIPFEYNYYLSISVYSKLETYQQEIKQLHHKNQPGIHTISNIISNEVKYGDKGLDIQKGFFILRSIDNKIGPYFRLGLSSDPFIKIVNTTYTVKSVRDSPGKLNGQKQIKFRTLSPVLVRDFNNRKLFVTDAEKVEENLNLATKWSLKNQFGISESVSDDISIKVLEKSPKTVRVSSGSQKESRTRAFDLRGEMTGDPGVLEVLYHRGLGSKPGLGLGCWEVL
jgi:CRISPR-associated endoribonuclease Cas6